MSKNINKILHKENSRALLAVKTSLENNKSDSSHDKSRNLVKTWQNSISEQTCICVLSFLWLNPQ